MLKVFAMFYVRLQKFKTCETLTLKIEYRHDNIKTLRISNTSY